MNKGMISPIIGLMMLGLIMLAFVYLKPAKLEENNASIYNFVDIAEQKRQIMRNMADQTITEAFADHVLERTIAFGNCDQLSDITSLNNKTASYLEDVNSLPETSRCSALFIEGNMANPGSIVLPGINNFEIYSAKIKINCLVGLQANNTPIVDLNKTYSVKKIRTIAPSGNTPPNCGIEIVDADSTNGFTQP